MNVNWQVIEDEIKQNIGCAACNRKTLEQKGEPSSPVARLCSACQGCYFCSAECELACLSHKQWCTYLAAGPSTLRFW